MAEFPDATITCSNGKTFQVPAGCFINNVFVDCASGQRSKLLNPATEEPLCEVVCGGEPEVNAAIDAAHAAFEGASWSGMPASDRGALLLKVALLIEENRETIATIESVNVGKPLSESLPYDLAQVARSFRYFSGWCDKFVGQQIPIDSNTTCFTTNVPLGVCGLITPFNFPLQLLCWKLAPALAVGNTVVIKSAEITPLSTLFLCKLFRAAGLPPGVVNVVPGKGSVIGPLLCRHRLVEKISFTGSVGVGAGVQAEASKGPWPKPTTLELGGKSPIIVFDDCEDLEKCLIDTHHALFWNAGQCCSAGSRVLVQRGIYDRYVARAVEMAKARKLGDPLESDVVQGPQVSKSQMESVLALIEVGKKEARLACGGARHGTRGYFVEPTIFADVNNSMRIAQEEVFGPVMCIIPFDTADEAIRIANDSDFGLVSAVYTANATKAMAVSQRMKAGVCWVNCYNVINPSTPWGGFKGSGHGRDLASYCLQGWTAPRATIIYHKL